MILPTKRLSERRSLLGMGAIILTQLKRPKDISRLWEDIKKAYSPRSEDKNPLAGKHPIQGPQTFTYEWFVLALDFLFVVNAITIEDGRISRNRALHPASQNATRRAAQKKTLSDHKRRTDAF